MFSTFCLVSIDVVVAPPSCYLMYVHDNLPPNVQAAAQNCYKAKSGAFTGEIRYVLGNRTTKCLLLSCVLQCQHAARHWHPMDYYWSL